jgi:hypothetical protein
MFTVKDGQYFEFKNSKVRLAEYVDAFSTENGSYEEGMYKVGVDIPAENIKSLRHPITAILKLIKTVTIH